MDADEKAFRCSVGWVIREGEKANPLAELQKAALPLTRCGNQKRLMERVADLLYTQAR